MGKRFKTIFIVILLVSVLLRMGMSFYLGSEVEDLPGTADQISYHTLALRILDGHGFTFGEPWWPATGADEPTAHWSFLYTGFLTAVYALFGPHPLAARLIQSILVGLLQPILIYLLGRRVFNPTIGLAAAAVTAGYAYFVYYAANLMTEPFYITAILASLYASVVMVDLHPQFHLHRNGEGEKGVRLGMTYGLTHGLALGLALGAALLLRQLFLLFVPFLFLWILWAGRGQPGFRQRILSLLVSTAVIAAIVLPITYYNYTRFHRFVLLNTNAGYAFFWGNHPSYGTRFIPILPSEDYVDMIPRELRFLDEAALDQALLRLGVQAVLADPVRYIQLSISRILPYFMFWPSEDSGLVSNIARVASFGVLWPFMLYGLVIAWARRSPPWVRNPKGLLLLFGFMAIYTVIHLLTWTLIRYRLPVDAVLTLFAGLALADLARRIPAFSDWVGMAA